MSHVATGIVQRRVVGSTTSKAVLMFMAASASDDGTGIWTSKPNMAADLEMNKRTVQRAVDALLTSRLISEVGKRKCKNGYTVEYKINLGVVQKLPSTRKDDDFPTGDRLSPLPQDIGGDRVSPVTERHLTGDRVTPQEVTECHPNHTGTIQEPIAADAAQYLDFDFDGFLKSFEAVYPRIGNRDQTAEALRTAIEDGATPSEILSGAKAYAAEQKGNAKRFIAFSQNWVEAKRWTEQEAEKPKANRQDILETRAKAIKEKRSWVANTVTANEARELIAARLVTEDECKAAGIAL